jgi:NAD(P)H-dependent FMN reductase
MTNPTLQIIISSTRPGRLGPTVGRWFREFAADHGGFDVQLVDLADFNLPIYDETNHPLMQQYEHEHTRRWSVSVDAADAYAFVMPEYNFNPPPSFVNALDYLHKEWNYKPAAFVSYSIGPTGGVRAAQTAKLLVTTMKMMPMLEGVMLPLANSLIDDAGILRSNELIDHSARIMLDELQRWTHGLKAMRENLHEPARAA